jgi:hypothetical protein
MGNSNMTAAQLYRLFNAQTPHHVWWVFEGQDCATLKDPNGSEGDFTMSFEELDYYGLRHGRYAAVQLADVFSRYM